MPNAIAEEAGRPSAAPLDDVVPITPSDTALADGPCRAILVTVGGTVNITTLSGNQRNAVPVNVGVNPIGATHIRAGGTATGIFAGY